MAPSSKRWSESETAHVLNYLDHCLKKGIDFRKTVSDELSRVAGREVTFSAVNSKLTYLFKDNGTFISFPDIVEKGTSRLNLSKLPPGILEAIQQQRSGLELEELNVVSLGDDSVGVATEAEHNVSSHLCPCDRQPNANSCRALSAPEGRPVLGLAIPRNRHIARIRYASRMPAMT
jgi:hypothetical protein